jgi:hypothetical protein
VSNLVGSSLTQERYVARPQPTPSGHPPPRPTVHPPLPLRPISLWPPPFLQSSTICEFMVSIPARTRVRASKAYPANDPPIQANIAGANAGAFPAFTRALSDLVGGGFGLLMIAKKGTSCLSCAYLSNRGNGGRPLRLDWKGGGGGAVRIRMISVWRRGMKPGIIAVPPVISRDEARVFRRSTGICCGARVSAFLWSGGS